MAAQRAAASQAARAAAAASAAGALELPFGLCAQCLRSTMSITHCSRRIGDSTCAMRVAVPSLKRCSILHPDLGYSRHTKPAKDEMSLLVRPRGDAQEKSVSLWAIIRECVGKDLTRICLPVYFNEPLSALQKLAEDLEYSALLDQARLPCPTHLLAFR